jgi:hypothetical protein
MICSQCGSNIAAGSAACPNCGAQQPGNVSQGAGTYPPPGPAGTRRAPAAATAGPAFDFDAKRWTRDEQIVGGASLLLLISLFLPWYTVSAPAVSILGKQVGGGSASASGTTGHGYLWIVFILALAIVAYMVIKAGFETLPFNLPVGPTALLLVLTGINLLLVLIAFLIKPGTGVGFELSVGWGFGAFVGLICAIAAVLPLAVPMIRARTAAS